LGLPVYRKKDRFGVLAPSEPPEIYKTESTYGAWLDIFNCCSINRRLLTEQIIFKKMCPHGSSCTQVFNASFTELELQKPVKKLSFFVLLLHGN